MNIADYPSMCRACLTESVSIRPVFNVEQIMGQEVVLSDMIMACTSVTIIKDDGLPSNICLDCIEELRKAFAFKQMCEESDNTLRSYVNNVTPLITHLDTNFEIEDIKPNVSMSEESSVVEDDKQIITSSWDYNLSLNEQCDCGCNVMESTAKSNVNIIENGRMKCKEKCLALAVNWQHGKNFNCDTCKKEFETQHLLKQHKAAHHIEDECPSDCKRNKTGISKKQKLPRTCEICNKTFRFHRNLRDHKIIHTGEKPYLCNVCGKGFSRMSYLKIHSFIHTGEKPYKCQMCDKSFGAPGTLLAHVRIHTGERPHVCKICGKDFPQLGHLSAHIRTHTGEKPVECKVCHRRFIDSGKLVIHMRIHSGEKPYSCKECGRCFAIRGTLKRHIRTHTGERPYVCSVCSEAFAQSGTLATHMKVHKPKQ